MSPRVAPAVKKSRVHALMQLSDELHDSYQRTWRGRVVQAVLEGSVSPEGTAVGLSENYLHVLVRAMPASCDTALKQVACQLEVPGRPYYGARFVPHRGPRLRD